jgi:hypothetical protein
MKIINLINKPNRYFKKNLDYFNILDINVLNNKVIFECFRKDDLKKTYLYLKSNCSLQHFENTLLNGSVQISKKEFKTPE